MAVRTPKDKAVIFYKKKNKQYYITSLFYKQII